MLCGGSVFFIRRFSGAEILHLCEVLHSANMLWSLLLLNFKNVCSPLSRRHQGSFNYERLRWNTYPRDVVHNYFGRRPPYWTLESNLSKCYCYVTTKVPLRFPSTRFNTQEQKCIDICHHYIKVHQAKGDIKVESVGTDDQLADMFTKPSDEARFCKVRNELNILDFFNMWSEHSIYD